MTYVLQKGLLVPKKEIVRERVPFVFRPRRWLPDVRRIVPIKATVAVDAVGTEGSFTGSPNASVNYVGLTVGSNTNGAIVVAVILDGGQTGSTNDWSSVTGYTQIQDINSGTGKRVSLWGKVGNSAGLQTITVTCNGTWASSTGFAVVGISFTGVNQTGGSTTFNNSTNGTGVSGTAPSLSVTTAITDCIVAAALWNTGFATASDTVMVTDTGAAISFSTQYALNKTSPHTVSWSDAGSDDWAMVATNVAAVGAGVTVPGSTLLLMGIG